MELRQHIKEHELLLDEDFKSLVMVASAIAAKMKDKAEKLLSGLNYEKKETHKMMVTFFEMLRDKLKGTNDVTEEMVKLAVDQLKQVGKLSAIVPLFMVPGGGTTTAVLYMLGKKYFGISILPRGLEQVFESVKNNLQEVKLNLDEAMLVPYNVN